MKHKDFWDLHQANSYLRQSLIRFDGRPFLVDAVDGRGPNYDIYGIFTDVIEDERQLVRYKINDAKIDMNPVPLGWVNKKVSQRLKVFQIIGMIRIPRRGWKIGLTPGSTSYISPPDGDRINGRRIWGGVEQAATIMGIFPTIEKILETLNNTPANYTSSIAFSRNFAIQKAANTQTFTIAHIFNPYESVGTIDPNGAWVELKNKYQYLEELLHKEMTNV